MVCNKSMLASQDFYSRTSCEVRRCIMAIITESINISTHAPLARCDSRCQFFQRPGIHISTHAPLARCDQIKLPKGVRVIISTHAPLARCDKLTNSGPFSPTHFYSRTSCEVRHMPQLICVPLVYLFLLTHLLRGATANANCTASSQFISTHAPLARCDPSAPTWSAHQLTISTHAPLARCDGTLSTFAAEMM